MKRDISKEAMRYIAVGAIGYLIDTSVFNVLSLFVDLGFGDFNPLANKTASSILAILFTYVGNSRWTFRARNGRREGVGRVMLYSLVNSLGLLISLLPLAFSRYVLGLDSLLADNLSANVFGTALALMFRFLAVRQFVFPK